MTQTSKAGERLGRAAARVTELRWTIARQSGLRRLALERTLPGAIRELETARRLYERS